MRFGLIAALVRKDLTETLRDRRTLFMMVFLPILLYPMVIALFSMVMQSRVESLAERPSRIVVIGDLPPGAISELQLGGRVDLEQLPAVDGGEEQFLATARDLVPSRADAAVAVPPDFARSISEGAAGKLWVYYDSVSDGSASASKRVVEALGRYRDRLLADRESSLGVPTGFARGVDTVTKDVAGNIAQASSGVKEANERVAQTATASKSIAQDVAGVNATVGEIRQGGEQVQASAGDLSKLAEQLKEMVGQLKV